MNDASTLRLMLCVVMLGSNGGCERDRAEEPASISLAATAREIRLAWKDNSDSEQSFDVQRRELPSGTYEQVGTVAKDVETYADTSVVSGTTYCYRVRAANSAGASAWSNEACGTLSTSADAGDLRPDGATGDGASVGRDGGQGTPPGGCGCVVQRPSTVATLPPPVLLLAAVVLWAHRRRRLRQEAGPPRATSALDG